MRGWEIDFNTVSFPALQSRSIWEESGRWQTYHDEGSLLRVEGRDGEEMCLAPTSWSRSPRAAASRVIELGSSVKFAAQVSATGRRDS